MIYYVMTPLVKTRWLSYKIFQDSGKKGYLARSCKKMVILQDLARRWLSCKIFQDSGKKGYLARSCKKMVILQDLARRWLSCKILQEEWLSCKIPKMSVLKTKPKSKVKIASDKTKTKQNNLQFARKDMGPVHNKAW